MPPLAEPVPRQGRTSLDLVRPLPLADRPLTQPHPDRLDPQGPAYDAVVAAHARALAEGRDRYVDPVTGYGVFTARWLADRGLCCGLGCRHCPYAAGPST